MAIAKPSGTSSLTAAEATKAAPSAATSKAVRAKLALTNETAMTIDPCTTLLSH